jgi:hypothetical protein
MKDIFLFLCIGYFIYAVTFKYCLIAMTSQVIFSFLMCKKRISKIIIMILLTQGIVVGISELAYDIIAAFQLYVMKIGLGNIIISSGNIPSAILYFFILIIILLIIGFFTYASIDGKMDLKKWISLILGYTLNITITVFLIFKFSLSLSQFINLNF